MSGLEVFSRLYEALAAKGLREAMGCNWPTQRVSQHPVVSTIYRVMAFFVTKKLRFGSMI